MTENGSIRKFIAALGTVLILLQCLLMISVRVQAKSEYEKAEGRVLFISSYSYSWDIVRMQIDGIMDNLGSKVVLDFEFMDTRRVDDDTAMQLFYEGLKYRLSQLEPYDVVILGDDAALRFALQYREELFEGIPLVFEGVNDEELAEKAAEDPLITGVIEKLSVAKNIELGLKLNPKAVRVTAILDDSLFGQAERAHFYSQQELFPELEFREINSSRLTTEQLKNELWKIGKNNIIIYVVMTEDGSGKKYSSQEALRMLTENTNVPIFCMLESGIGEGILGGNVVSIYKSGELAALLAMDVICGKGVAEELAESPNIFCFDYKLMKNLNLDISVLPEGTVFINQDKTYFERNREAVIPAAVLVIALLVVMGVICFDNVRGRKLQKELEEAKTIMESASQHDFLTGLPNRSKFMEDLEHIIGEKKPCTVIMLDIDDFKKINDSYGHSAGDDALRQVAARLKELTSPILSAYRFAGDEFIMIQQSSQRKIVEKTAYQCRQVFTRNFVLGGEKRQVYGSIGLASYPADAEDLEQLIVCADDAMYQVKKNGKNDFAFYQKPTE